MRTALGAVRAAERSKLERARRIVTQANLGYMLAGGVGIAGLGMVGLGAARYFAPSDLYSPEPPDSSDVDQLAGIQKWYVITHTGTRQMSAATTGDGATYKNVQSIRTSYGRGLVKLPLALDVFARYDTGRVSFDSVIVHEDTLKKLGGIELQVALKRTNAFLHRYYEAHPVQVVAEPPFGNGNRWFEGLFGFREAPRQFDANKRMFEYGNGRW